MVELADVIWADGPSSMPQQPPKSKIRAWGKWLEGLISAFLGNSGLVYTSRAALYADLAHPANSSAWVIGDATVAYNGVYVKSGSSGSGAWSRVSDLPFSFIVANDAGAGTPNAIQATTSIPVSGSALVWMQIADTNTGSPVTVQFNGGALLTVKTNSGNNPAAGGLVSGMSVLGIVTGATFRLLSDQISTAVVAAAEAAQAAAEAAANSVNQRIFTTRADAQASTIPAIVKRVLLHFRSPNYLIPSTLCGGANYRRVSLVDLTGFPAAAFLRSADRFMPDGTTDATNGGYWLLDERIVDVAMLGAVGDAGVSGASATNDTAAFQAANDYLTKSYGGGEVRYYARHYLATSLNLSRGICVRGPSENADPGNSFSTVTSMYAFMRAAPALILASSAEIRLSSACSLTSNYIFRAGLALDGTDLAASYAGTPINIITASLTTDGVLVSRNTIAGFSQAIRAQDAGRFRIENNVVDANNGFWLTNCGDFGRCVGNHLYNLLQANATGHDTASLRSGTAFKFDGTPMGGTYLLNNFDYGYNVSVDIQAAGQIVVGDHWADGPTVLSTLRPVDPNSIGIRTGSISYIEAQFHDIKISCKGTSWVIGNNAKGITPIDGLVMWQNNVGFSVTGQNLHVTNFSIRGYDAAFNFNSKIAANTAKLTMGVLFDRNAVGNPAATPPTGIADPIDINAGTGIPIRIGVSRTDGNLDVRNELRADVTAAAGVITIPNSQPSVRVTAAATITNILPAYDDATVTLEASGSGMILASGTNLLMVSTFTSTQAGGNVTLKYSRWINKWVEVSRGPQ